MSDVAIIGYGYVGKGMHRIFPDAVLVDPKLCVPDHEDYPEAQWDTMKHLANTCRLAIVCVPTPPEGSHEQAVRDEETEFLPVDLSAVEEVVSWLETPLILIKSTVPPGTTARLRMKYGKRICFSPEYMGEGGYYIPPEHPDPQDPRQHRWTIIGGQKRDCDEIVDIFMPKLGPTKTFFTCSSLEAELIKYMENTWIATKVTFANEWRSICEAFGASYHTVREGWALDSRVEKMHTAVFPEKRGFGGKCLPKDLHGIVAACRKEGHEPEMLKQIWNVNRMMRVVGPRPAGGSKEGETF